MTPTGRATAQRLAFGGRHRYNPPLTGWRAARVCACGHALPPQTLFKDSEMPKLKTKSGAKKRFGITASGKVKRNWGHKRHLLINKSKQGKRLRRGTTTLEKGDANLVLTYMPYLRG
jgi:large subunit ribosomal protein L35